MRVCASVARARVPVRAYCKRDEWVAPRKEPCAVIARRSDRGRRSPSLGQTGNVRFHGSLVASVLPAPPGPSFLFGGRSKRYWLLKAAPLRARLMSIGGTWLLRSLSFVEAFFLSVHAPAGRLYFRAMRGEVLSSSLPDRTKGSDRNATRAFSVINPNTAFHITERNYSPAL